MSISSRLEIRTNVLDISDQVESQVGSMVNNFINLTLHEIETPGWAFGRKEMNHYWSFLRRKYTFPTVANTTDYLMPRDLDRIGIMRQITSPSRLIQLSDEDFFDFMPDPENRGTGNPIVYRMWEVSGVSTKLAAADTIDIVSSSTSDDGDSDLSVTVWGYSGGILVSENYVLNGTTTVSGTISFDADDVFVSKSKQTVGTITVTENSGGTTLVTLGKEDRGPIFQVVSLYPTPGSAITMYVEYYSRMRDLVNDSDVPQFDSKWHYVVVLGTLAKMYQHLGKETSYGLTYQQYKSAVKAMVMADRDTPDLRQNLKRINRTHKLTSGIRLRRSEDVTF